MFSSSEKWSEDELLRQVACSSEKALSELIDRFSDVLGKYIFKITHSMETTEEAVQDVLLTVWQHREALPQIKNFEAWLFVVARNQALMALRKIVRERLKNKKLSEATFSEDNGDLEDIQWQTLERAVDLLPPQQKRAYILSRREGFSYNEIAAEMGISKETVKKHLQYATHFLITKVKELLTISW